MNLGNIKGKLVILSLLPLALTACSGEEDVSYTQDVKPILDSYCIECHTAGQPGQLASGFSMADYQSLMKGTHFGPMVIPGDAEGSNMVVLMEGRADPSISMPHGQQKQIPTQNIETIRLWIDQGAKDN